MSAIPCVTGGSQHHWFWMNYFFSSAYQLQQRVMVLSPCSFDWGYKSIWLLQGLVGIRSRFPLEAMPALPGTTHLGRVWISPVVNRSGISLFDLIPGQVCNSRDAALETKGRFFPKGRKLLAGRKYQAVSNLRSSARGTRGILHRRLSTSHKGEGICFAAA